MVRNLFKLLLPPWIKRAMEYVVLLKDLTKRFGSFTAVDRLNLSIDRGELFGFLGPNGAGKTTTIRMICGLLEPTEGEILVFGHRMPQERIKVLKRIGYMPQHFGLYEDLTVYENLDFYASLYGMSRNEKRRRINELLDVLLLKPYVRTPAGKLSGGTKKRLALAVALIHEPELLILDEPTAGVDPPLRRMFWKYFKELNKAGVTIIVTTHYMDEAENCRRLVLMSRGKILAEGSPLEVKRRAFGGDLISVRVRHKDKHVLMAFEEKLKQLPGILEASLRGLYDHGTEYLVIVEDASELIDDIVRIAENAGLEVSVSQVQVSLEDAFIKLLEGEHGQVMGDSY